jgi:hypothetical protein
MWSSIEIVHPDIQIGVHRKCKESVKIPGLRNVNRLQIRVNIGPSGILVCDIL